MEWKNIFLDQVGDVYACELSSRCGHIANYSVDANPPIMNALIASLLHHKDFSMFDEIVLGAKLILLANYIPHL